MSQIRSGAKADMAYKDVFWMACDSTEQLRAEYGPFHTRHEAEAEARKPLKCTTAFRRGARRQTPVK